MMRAALPFGAALLASNLCLAAETTGVASVIDGDTLDLHGQRIRLYAVDAPESRQTCIRDGRPWRCGQQAALALQEHIGRQTVTCEQRDIDRYRRIVAICRVGGQDLNAWLVSQGWALAYRQYAKDYAAQEVAAAAARAGIWAGTFDKPWEWRRAQRADNKQGARLGVTQAAAPPDCRIKGNISGNGRVYHLPGSRDYARTTITPEKGERWFCSEKQARAAGWRPAKG